MNLYLDLDGIDFYFKIEDYYPSRKNKDYWCRVTLDLVSSKWLNYYEHSKILLSYEVEDLRDKIKLLLNNELIEKLELDNVEPDLIFYFLPSYQD